MSREQAIEQAARDFIDTNGSHERNRLIDALAMPKDAEPVAFINIEKRRLEWNTDSPVRFETPTIVKMDKLPLYAHPPKADAERVALLERVYRADWQKPNPTLLHDIHAYLGGDK